MAGFGRINSTKSGKKFTGNWGSWPEKGKKRARGSFFSKKFRFFALRPKTTRSDAKFLKSGFQKLGVLRVVFYFCVIFDSPKITKMSKMVIFGIFDCSQCEQPKST